MSKIEVKVKVLVDLANNTTDSDVEHILNELLVENDYCPECGQPITDDDFEGVYESRGEFHGAPCSEWVPTRFICPECGNEEEF